MSRMPEHDFSVAGHRSALLMKFSESGSTGPGGLWTPSMHGNLCAGASTTSGLLQLSSCKIDSNNKSSQQQGGTTTAAGQRSQVRVATLSTVPARMSSTGDQGGAGGGRGGGEVADVGPPTTSRKVGARSPKISTKRNGRRNPSLSALSEKEPKRKEKEKHNLGSMEKGSASSTKLLSVEAVEQGVRDCRKGAKKSAASSTTSVKTEGVGLLLTVEATSKPPVIRRGVRKRPGVKGFLVEIRPKRWKKTIWLGTYSTEWEACRAYDAGIFYTKKALPFHYPDSKGSFPDLPPHLSLGVDEDPRKLEEVKQFIKAEALKASKRAIDAVTVDSLECSLDSSTYSDAGSNPSSKSVKVAKTTWSSCCPVTAKEEEQEQEEEEKEDEEEEEKEEEEKEDEDEEEEQEEQVDIQIQTPNTEEVIKNLDSFVHLCTGEKGGLSSSQDDMGEGLISPEERNLDTMTKDSQKLLDDEQMLVSPSSHFEGAIPVDYHSMIKYASPEFIYYETKGKLNNKFGKLCIPGFSMDLPENMTQDWSTKTTICNNLDTQFYPDYAIVDLWGLGNVGKIMWQGRDLLKAWLRPFSLDCLGCLQFKWFP